LHVPENLSNTSNLNKTTWHNYTTYIGRDFDNRKEYQIPSADLDNVIKVINLRENDHTYTEIADNVDVSKATAQCIVDRREYHAQFSDQIDSQ